MILKQSDFSHNQNDILQSLKSKPYKQLHRVLATIISIARTCPVEYRYPILKLLKELSKTFRLNQFQATFFAYVVRETKWNFREQLIIQNSEQVNEIINSKNNEQQFKCVILYLVLIIFTLKKFLNENYQFFLEKGLQICPNLVNIFQKWSKKHSKLTKKFNPKTLNKIYQELNYKSTEHKPNFNTLVDSIIDISPSYNPDFNKNKKYQNKEKVRNRKKSIQKDKQANQQSHSSMYISIHKNEENINAEINPVFSTQRIHQMVEEVCFQNNMIEVSDFQVLGLKEIKKFSYNFEHSLFESSENSAELHFSLKDEDYFSYSLKVGLEEGESQQNFKVNQKEHDSSNNVILSQSRLNLTDQFLTWKAQGQQENY